MSQEFCSFVLGGEEYCIAAAVVQEVLLAMPTTKIPLAPEHLQGLINIRGQVAVCLELEALLKTSPGSQKSMLIVCRSLQGLVALRVDDVGDVIYSSEGSWDDLPTTLPQRKKENLKRILRIQDKIYCELDFDSVCKSFIGKEGMVA